MQMDLVREASRRLVTTVALVTTVGRYGANVMAAEWTFQVSYQPMRFIVLVYSGDATHDNIMKSKEFGVNFLSTDDAILANIAGSFTGNEVNKLSSELFRTYSAKQINAPMISGCFLNAECRLIQVLETGDHTMFLGEVVNVQVDQSKNPLLYTQRQYWQLGPNIEKRGLIFLTCTARNSLLLLEGRLQGVNQHPQQVELRVKFYDVSIVNATAESDEQGYFTLRHQFDHEPKKGLYEATATWKEFKGTACQTV